ncbi:MAG TPA: hypothetical protein VKB02_10225 [Pyrinomonadaceae bacterium]|nr:hypothetical protein [Pyrinomonadaceae bacterium]
MLSILAVVGTVAVVIALKQHAGTFTESWQNGKRIIHVGPQDSVQSALDSAQYGDTIVVQAGETFTGNFVLPMKSGTGEIVIQSSSLDKLPEGVRVKPSQSKAKLFPILQTPNSEPVIATAPGAHHYRFQGIEFSTDSSNKMVYDLIRFGGGRKEQKTLDSVPHDLEIDRCYIHGFDTQDVQRGVALNSAATTVKNSYISNIHGVGYDTQAIAGWNGPGPFEIINNHLEAAGENIMFGGADPGIKGLVPAGIKIRENYLFKPLSWKVGHPSYAGKHWTVKNLLELKNAKDVVIDGNYFENCWTDGQTGIAILFTVRNQEGTAPWSILQNIAFKNNIVIGAEGALNFLGSDNERPSQRSSVADISNNLFFDMRGPFLTMNGFENVSITHNTHFQTGNITILYGAPLQEQFVYRDNLTMRDSKGYGVFGDATGEGTVALRKFAPKFEFTNNVLIGADASLYPKVNQFPASIDRVGFVSFKGTNYCLGPGSAYKNVGADCSKLNFSAKTPE